MSSVSIGQLGSGWLRLSNDKIRLTITLGNQRVTTNAGSLRGGLLVSDAAMKMITQRVADSTVTNLGQLVKELHKTLENSYVEAVRYAAQSMIGRASPRGIDNRNEGYTVQIEYLNVAKWKALAPRSIREQNQIQGTKHSGKFFLRSGALRKEIMAFARQYVKKTGVVKITSSDRMRDSRGRFSAVNSDTKLVKLSKFSIRLLPNISPAALPGLRSGNVQDFNANMNFERALGMSPEAVRKLSGATREYSGGDLILPGTHRPLMQPVFTYWTMFKIPALVAEKVLDATNIQGLSGKL